MGEAVKSDCDQDASKCEGQRSQRAKGMAWTVVACSVILAERGLPILLNQSIYLLLSAFVVNLKECYGGLKASFIYGFTRLSMEK